MTLYHAQTMKELRIDKEIEQSYDEDSQEYKELCKEYTNIIGFTRELDKDVFDKKLLEELVKQDEQLEMETVKQIEDTVKQCYLQGTTAYITFGGYMINPKEFCAISSVLMVSMHILERSKTKKGRTKQWERLS